MTARMLALILAGWLAANAALADEPPAGREETTAESPHAGSADDGEHDDARGQRSQEPAQQPEQEPASETASGDHFVPTEQLRYDQEVDYPADI